MSGTVEWKVLYAEVLVTAAHKDQEKSFPDVACLKSSEKLIIAIDFILYNFKFNRWSF